MAKKSGVTVKDLYWTLEFIAVCEAPDDKAATALSFSVCSRGNVRSQTLAGLLVPRNEDDPQQDGLRRCLANALRMSS